MPRPPIVFSRTSGTLEEETIYSDHSEPVAKTSLVSSVLASSATSQLPLELSNIQSIEGIGPSQHIQTTATSSLEDIVSVHLGSFRCKLLQDLRSFMDSDARHSDTSAQDRSSRGARKRSQNGEVVALVDPALAAVVATASLKSQESRAKFHCITKEGEEDFAADRASTVRRCSSIWTENALWPVWELDIDQQIQTSRTSMFSVSNSQGFATKITGLGNVVRTGDAVISNGYCQLCIMRPSSAKRVAWDIMTVVCIGYDIILIPMVVFDLSKVYALRMIALIMAIFWTADIFLTFFVGFHTSGVIEMRPRRIAQRYFKTWFFLDLLVVACDWFVVLDDSFEASGGDSVGVARVSKSFRVARVVGALRFLRVCKVVHLVSAFNEYMHFENVIQVLGIVNFTLVILIINHYIACGWYALAAYYPDGIASTWLSDLRSESNQPGTFLFEYTSSLHWSFTQFTPASMEIHPRNTLERAYSIVVLLSGLVVFSSFVSGITSAMTRVREHNRERNLQEENLRRYITDNKVSLELGRRIYNYVRSHSLMNRARVLEKDISAFKALPPHLLLDLHAEVFLPVLTRHPFFLQFLHLDETGLVDICHSAVGEIAAVKGQHIFSFKQKAFKMIFGVDGFLMYFLGADAQSAHQEEIDRNSYLAEAALWVPWLHKGRLEASGNCVVLELRVEDFHNSARKTRALKSCAGYAREFAETILTDSSGNFLHMSDVSHDDNVISELARSSFEEQFEELQERVGVLKRAESSIGDQGHFVNIMHFFRKRPSDLSGSKVLRTSIRNSKRTSLRTP